MRRTISSIDSIGLVPVDAQWPVARAVPTSLAVPDPRLARRPAGRPAIIVCLLDRLAERSARLTTTQAISQFTRVDRSLAALIWTPPALPTAAWINKPDSEEATH